MLKIFYILGSLGGIGGVFLGIKKFIGWKWPLGISVNIENLIVIRGIYREGFILKKHPWGFFMNVDFTNKRSEDFDVSFSNFVFYPKEINGIEFEILNRILEKKDIGIYTEKISIKPGSKSTHVYIKIKPKDDLKLEDFLELLKKYENTTVYLKFDYTIAGKRKKPVIRKIKNFFEYLANGIKKS